MEGGRMRCVISACGHHRPDLIWSVSTLSFLLLYITVSVTRWRWYIVVRIRGCRFGSVSQSSCLTYRKFTVVVTTIDNPKFTAYVCIRRALLAQSVWPGLHLSRVKIARENEKWCFSRDVHAFSDFFLSRISLYFISREIVHAMLFSSHFKRFRASKLVGVRRSSFKSFTVVTSTSSAWC